MEIREMTMEDIEKRSLEIEEELKDENADVEKLEAEVEELPGSDFITYGCWVKVLDEKNNKEIIYHIPLKDDHSRAWYGIEEKMMGQNVGFRVFLAGRHYTVIAFGRDDREDTKAEFNVSLES